MSRKIDFIIDGKIKYSYNDFSIGSFFKITNGKYKGRNGRVLSFRPAVGRNGKSFLLYIIQIEEFNTEEISEGILKKWTNAK